MMRQPISDWDDVHEFGRGLIRKLKRGENAWLFLDYDGTLSELAPTPAHIDPDPELEELLTSLAAISGMRVSVISGRRLSHVRELLPVTGLIMAGTYGIELHLPEQGKTSQVAYDDIRPILEELKPRWAQLIEGRNGFFLEDKGWAIALHGRHADPDEAEEVLAQAEAILEERQPLEEFRVLGGYKFLELGPKRANKGDTLHYLLQEFPLHGASLVYLGDDDKDEEAFEVINDYGGTAILVLPEARETHAAYRLSSPRQTRDWLWSLVDAAK